MLTQIKIQDVIAYVFDTWGEISKGLEAFVAAYEIRWRKITLFLAVPTVYDPPAIIPLEDFPCS